MDFTRRELVTAAAVLVGTGALAAPAMAASGDEAAVIRVLDDFRRAVFAQDKAKLDIMTAAQLTYGHSDGRVQNKAEFIDGVMTRKGKMVSLNFPQTSLVALLGDTAIIRHIYQSETENEGKAHGIMLPVICTWYKEAGGWKLLARQGYKLAV